MKYIILYSVVSTCEKKFNDSGATFFYSNVSVEKIFTVIKKKIGY